MKLQINGNNSTFTDQIVADNIIIDQLEIKQMNLKTEVESYLKLFFQRINQQVKRFIRLQ
ncbi:unnamed protein product [Paramecium sonneborni]|uniref:Uncharacterized protein n=1 Tax=Paramecium sonneborni TaxID=65129 RepID=A0A8S1QB00_9CILI|nr:unnamed protein product [Paramecium sonneborni]